MRASSASVTAPLQCLPTLELDGAWQMALDDWMLEQRQPLLRLYRWRRPTLSLGRHQRRIESHWLDLARSGALDLVRRPSGGRAVLHGDDLTYALVWPDAAGSREEVYRQACRWLQEAFAALGQPLEFGRRAARGQHASCFALSTAADLVHRDGSKRIGSAQYWRQGCLLQHGSIQLRPSQLLWRKLFQAPPPPLAKLPLTDAELEQALLTSMRRWLPIAADGVVPVDLGSLPLVAISRRAAQFQLAFASPDATMERTTGASASPKG